MYCGRKRDGELRFTRINHIHALCMLCLTSCAISEFPIWFHYFRSNRLQLDFETQQFSQTRDLTVQLGEKQISVWLLAGLKTNSPTCTRSSHSISFEWKIWGAFEFVIRACEREGSVHLLRHLTVTTLLMTTFAGILPGHWVLLLSC